MYIFCIKFPLLQNGNILAWNYCEIGTYICKDETNGEILPKITKIA